MELMVMGCQDCEGEWREVRPRRTMVWWWRNKVYLRKQGLIRGQRQPCARMVRRDKSVIIAVKRTESSSSAIVLTQNLLLNPRPTIHYPLYSLLHCAVLP